MKIPKITIDLKGIAKKLKMPSVRFGTKTFVCLDFASDSLRIAVASGTARKKEIVYLASHNISGLSEAQISEIVRMTVNQLQLVDPVVVANISSGITITKNIEIPSKDPREIKEIINLQAIRHTPYSRQEIIIDYIDIGIYRQSYTKILLVIVTREAIKRQLDILNLTALNIERITLSAEAMGCLCIKCLKLESPDSPIAVVNVDSVSSDFTIILKGKPVFARSIPYGASQVAVENKVYGPKFIDEIKKSLEAYQGEDIEASPNSLVVTGAIEGLKGLEVELNNVLRMPCRVISYKEQLPIAKNALEASSNAADTSFVNCIAPLLCLDAMKVDLSPDEIKLKRTIESRGRDVIKTGICVTAIIFLACGILLSKMYFKSAYLKSLAAKYDSVKKDSQRLETLFKKIKILRDYLSKRGYSLEVLSEINSIIPKEAYLDNLKVDDGGNISIKGSSETTSAVFSLVDALEKSEYLMNVKTKYTTKRKQENKDMTDFEIVGIIERK